MEYRSIVFLIHKIWYQNSKPESLFSHLQLITRKSCSGFQETQNYLRDEIKVRPRWWCWWIRNKKFMVILITRIKIQENLETYKNEASSRVLNIFCLSVLFYLSTTLLLCVSRNFFFLITIIQDFNQEFLVILSKHIQNDVNDYYDDKIFSYFEFNQNFFSFLLKIKILI